MNIKRDIFQLYTFTFYFRSHYGTAHTDESVYIIGGLSDFTTSILDNTIPSKISTIAEYKNGVWTKIGNLKQARESHGAIQPLEEEHSLSVVCPILIMQWIRRSENWDHSKPRSCIQHLPITSLVAFLKWKLDSAVEIEVP